MKCLGKVIGTALFSVLVLGAASAYGADLRQPSGDSWDSFSVALAEDADEGLQAEESGQDQPDQTECYVDCSPACAPKPWKLPQPSTLQCMGIDMGGWAQQGITFNNYGHEDTFNGPTCTNDLNQQFQLNQLWLYFVRPTNTGGCGVDVGGRIDLSYGTDWRYGECTGLEDRIDSPNSYYGLVLPQFYMEVAVDDLTVKMGHFATFTSYEVVPAPMNFFYSHSHLMGGCFDPLLVTGLQADYKLCEHWTAVGGFNRGWEVFEDPADDDLNFLGGVRYAGDDKRATMSLLVDAGRQVGFTGVHDRNTVYLVYTYQLNKCLLYASQIDVGQENNGSVVTPGEDADYYGLEQVLIRKLNDKWSAGLRYEWVCDEEGARIAGVGTKLGTNKGLLLQPGLAGSFHDLSLGLNYRPHPNFVLRPEVRWDWYDGPANPAGQLPFDNFEATDQFTTAMDLIVTF
jgi:hypothetical protein